MKSARKLFRAAEQAWIEQESIALESGAKVQLWQHKSTKARLRLISTAGPMANLYVVLATEAVPTEWGAKPDDGLPHTLEHLIFLGSEKYPYKGILDKLANRCLARGTNAWTDVDHTAYTATTAGSKGLLALLPIYIDHILRPTLTDEAFVTEVHHVTGEGEDKGVVYCEMQGREFTAESLAERACLGTLYPNSGYSAETGGICANLRELTNDKVRRYHAEFYRPDNLCVIVTGCVDPEPLLSVLDDALTQLSSSSVSAITARPWTSSVPEPNWPSSPLRVEFPSEDDESTGLVVLAWRGERYHSFFDDAKSSILWAYLADGAASPLSKAFVNSGDCSGVFPTSERFQLGYRQLWFEDVDARRIFDIQAKFDATLDELAASGIEVARMKDVIARATRRTTSSLEDDPATAVVSPVLKHFLYADDCDNSKSLTEPADALAMLEAVSKVGKMEWDAALETLRTRPKLCVVAQPSKKAAEQQRNDERCRIETKKTTLGQEGLKRVEEMLKEAMQYNERDIPHQVLAEAVQPADISEAKSKMFDVTRVLIGDKSHPLAALARGRVRIGSDGDDDQQIVLDHVDGTKFCRVDVCADTSTLSVEDREYLPLLAELMFKSPLLQDDGSVMPYDTAVEELRRETVSYSAGVQGGPGTLDLFFIGSKLDAETAGLATGTDVVLRAAYRAQFVPDRLAAAVSKLSLELQSDLRDGNSVAWNVLRGMVFDDSATNQGLLVSGRQKLFLDRAKQALSPLGILLGQRRKLLKTLRQARANLFLNAKTPVVARFSGDLKMALQTASTPLDLSPIAGAGQPLAASFSPKPLRNVGCVALVGVSSLEGGAGYLVRYAPGLGLDDPESQLAALSVCIEYLTALEGDFWTQIRGAGLAYGARVRADPINRLVQFSLYRSVDPVKALKAARSIVQAYADGSTQIRDLDLENARGSLASGLIEAEKTRSMALAASWRRGLIGLDHDRDKRFLDAVANVDKEAALAALKNFIAPLFNDELSVTAITCAPGKIDTIAENLATKAHIVKHRDVLDAFRDRASTNSKWSVPKTTLLAAIAAAALGVVVLAKRRRS